MACLLERVVANPMLLSSAGGGGGGGGGGLLYGRSFLQSGPAQQWRKEALGRLCSSTRTGCKRIGKTWQACSAGEQGEFSNELREGRGLSSSSAYFTGTAGVLNVQESTFFAPPQPNKGWDDYRLQAQLRSLAVMADDRSEMHAAVAIQRDNWGKLLQVTITMSMISAGILSALNTRAAVSFSLSLTAALLAAGSFVFMCLENWFQPSQLAEEQRAAARFFKNLVKEIESSLKPGGSHLKEAASLYYEAKLERLQYLDRAFPLPLFPGGIDKFPGVVGPSVLSAPVDVSKPEVPLSGDNSLNNGWTPAIVEDLKRTSELLRRSDIATYVGMEKNAQIVNKILAVAGPCLALVGIVGNCMAGGAAVAAGSCVMAALASSFSHDAQVGMVYEMYREVAGSFEDIDKEIQRNLRLPVDQRENGELFHDRIALILGRKDGEAIVSSKDQKTAGTVL